MGNTLSSMTSIPNVVNADYKLVGKTTNIRWGELFEMRNIKTGQYTFMQEKYAVNQEVHQKNVQDCSYRVSLVHKNLATIYGFAHNDNLDSFTNTFKLCIFFEHTPSNLSEVIRAHKTSMLSPQQQQSMIRSTIAVKYFDESELLGYMDQLIDVLSFLQNNGINQGDITPEVCMVSSNGSVKLLDKKLIFNDTTSFALAGQGMTNVFLTPAELEALSGEESQPFENRYKADVFRLGMTLLECATLKKSAQIYDWSNYVIDLELLATRLAEVRERYSTSVYGPLREMLRFEEHKRPDFKQLRQSMQEDFNRTLLTTASMITPRGGGEENLKKSMGPKLVTSGSPRPDLTLSRNKPGSHSRVTSSQDMMETFKSAFKDVFDIGKKTKAKAKKEKREEDLDDDMVEMDENMKINQVPYTEEAKLTVVSNNDGRLYKTSSMKVAAVDRFGEEDARGDTRLFKTMSVSEQVPWNSKVNLLKDNGAGEQQKERRRGSIFGVQKTEGDSKSMAVRPHSRTVVAPDTSSSLQYDGINFQNAINLSQVNNGGQYGEHYKTSIPPVQMAKSQTSYHSFPPTDERQDTVSGNLSSRLKFNENFQTSYIPAVDDSPVSLHSQRYHTARDYDPAHSTGDIYDPEGYKKQGYKPSFKLNLGENRYGLDDYGTKSWSTTTRENDRYNKYLAKDYEVHSSRPEYPEYTKTTSYLDNNNTYTTTTSKPKVEKSLEAIKHPINDYLKTITSGSSLSYNTKSPLMYEHSRQQSYSGVSQAGYIDTGIKPYALTTTSSKLESIIGRKDYSPILEKSFAKEDDQYSSTTIGKGSAGLKIGEYQPEKPGTTNINDRFEQAMERSRRSKGFVRDMSTAMNRSGSRTGSVERGGSGFTSGIMTSNLVGLKIKP